MGGRVRGLTGLYVILDAETLERQGVELVETGLRLRDAGVRLFQYRDKRGDAGRVLEEASALAGALAGSGCLLVLNDYPELVGLSGFGGVHVGQSDLGAAAAREVIGAERVLGVSTHDETQMRLAADGPADYLAIGPVFRTSTKTDAEPAVGLEGVRRTREITRKPLVAIGGVTARNARQVVEAGADAVAVIGALFVPGRGLEESARELLMAAEIGGAREV